MKTYKILIKNKEIIEVKSYKYIESKFRLHYIKRNIILNMV